MSARVGWWLGHVVYESAERKAGSERVGGGAVLTLSSFVSLLEGWDAVLQKRLVWALFLLFNPCVLSAFCFINFPILLY